MTSVLDLTDLGRLTAVDGPYLSVYLPAESAAQQWAQLRVELAEQGAPASALALVDPMVMDRETNETLAVITDATKVLVTDHLDESFIYARGQWAATADLVPIIKARQEHHVDAIEDDDERRAQKTAIADETVDLLERFKEGKSADGIQATVEALNRGEVEVLLVRDDRDERRNVPREDAAVVDALVRDAIARGVSVHVIPASGPVTEGVGALLR